MAGVDLKTDDSEFPIPWLGPPLRQGDESLALAVVWCHDEPERVGQVIFIDPEGSWVGRMAGSADSRENAAPLVEQRPGQNTVKPPLSIARLSRHQLRVTPRGEALVVQNTGKRGMLKNGETVEKECTVCAGDTLSVENVVEFFVEPRPRELMGLAYELPTDFAFGAADRFGMVGESAAAWALRDRLAMAASMDTHVLIQGDTGSGKELAAAMIHGLSRRARGPFRKRSAVSIPEALVDAELFGNNKNYPNPGMRERPGLIGAANGGHLMLDEIGEVSEQHQAHLLRVVDTEGCYQRLGETVERYSDVRLLAATNRPQSALKHDLLARFHCRIMVSGLHERRSDIPLLVRDHLATLNREAPEQVGRFLRDGDPARAILDPALIDVLVRHHYLENTRELQRVLMAAVTSSHGDGIALTPAVYAELAAASRRAAEISASQPGALEKALQPGAAEGLDLAPAAAGDSRLPRASRQITGEQVVGALTATRWNITAAAARLGLSRDALRRLMHRLEIELEH